MLTVLILFVCLGVKGEEFTPLGRAIYLPSFNIMGKLEETGTEILLKDLVGKCSVSTPAPIASQDFTFYKSTKTFYSSMGTSSSLSTSLQASFSMGFTLDVNSKSISGSKRTIAGNSLLIMSQTYQNRIYKECLQDQTNLNPEFLNDFQKLPKVIDQPWMGSSWAAYDMFLHKYGSHVITSITYGSSINQMAFAESSESYTEHDFKVKSCMSLGGGASESQVSNTGVEACSGIDQSEINTVSSMTMSDTLVIRGGTPETRNELLAHRDAELISKFMDEAYQTNATISYAFMSVWEMLQVLSTSIGSQDNFIRATNLEYYYLGYLNYGCPLSDYQDQNLQTFNFSQYHTTTAPQYECTLTHTGCHNDDSCHYEPIWCACKGTHCVMHHDNILETGDIKTTAIANTDSNWGWQGCDWKPGLAGSKCICRWPSSVRVVVWSLEGKSASYAMMENMATLVAKQAKLKKQEL